MIDRQALSYRYAKGRGLEIGAFHNPFPITAQSSITYLDKWSYDTLIETRNNDKNLSNNLFIPPVDIIDDGQSLAKVKDESYDFVVSSHCLEHCPSALTALENQLRVIRPKGYVICVVPDRDNSIDRERKLTSLEHTIFDYEDSISFDDRERSNKVLLDHFDEYLFVVDKIIDKEERIRRGKLAIQNKNDIHFHVWDAQSLVEMLAWAQGGLDYRFWLECFYREQNETFFVLRKK